MPATHARINRANYFPIGLSHADGPHPVNLMRFLLSLALALAFFAPAVRAQPGLPVEEHFDDDIGGRGWATQVAELPYNKGIGGAAFISLRGRPLETPATYITVLAASSGQPLWTGIERATFSFGGRKLVLKGNKATQHLKSGDIIESLTMRVPYADFRAIVNSSRLYVTVKGTPFEVSRQDRTGLRALLGKVESKSSVAKTNSGNGTLQKGDSGDAVLRWQVFLINQGLMEPPALGNFVDRTYAATISFQKRYKLRQTGKVDAPTAARARQLGYKK